MVPSYLDPCLDLLECPLHSDALYDIFGEATNIHYIFSTYHGSRKLGDFLLATQALLLPLSPRPDPP